MLPLPRTETQQAGLWEIGAPFYTTSCAPSLPRTRSECWFARAVSSRLACPNLGELDTPSCPWEYPPPPPLTSSSPAPPLAGISTGTSWRAGTQRQKLSRRRGVPSNEGGRWGRREERCAWGWLVVVVVGRRALDGIAIGCSYCSHQPRLPAAVDERASSKSSPCTQKSILLISETTSRMRSLTSQLPSSSHVRKRAHKNALTSPQGVVVVRPRHRARGCHRAGYSPLGRLVPYLVECLARHVLGRQRRVAGHERLLLAGVGGITHVEGEKLSVASE